MVFTNSTLFICNKHLSLTQRFSVFLPVCPGPLAFPERNRQFHCTALMLKATILLRTASKSGPRCSKGGCTDSAIHRINPYPVYIYQGNLLRYPVVRDLSGGQRYPPFEQLGPGQKNTDPYLSNFLIPFATSETRRKLSPVNQRKDSWDS